MTEEDVYIGTNVQLGDNVTIKRGCIIEDDVIIKDNVYLDYRCIVRKNVTIGSNTTIGAGCILGEYTSSFHSNHNSDNMPLVIGENGVIRSDSVIYAGSTLGDNLQTGHHVTIRENSTIGHHVSIGTLSDVQGHCILGDYVRLHSNVFVAPATKIENYCWIMPGVILTNDPTPPSDVELGVHINQYAVVSAGSVVVPGVEIGENSLIGAGTVVTKNVSSQDVILGSAGRSHGKVNDVIERDTGEAHYPWQYRFDRYMPWKGVGYDEWKKSIE